MFLSLSALTGLCDRLDLLAVGSHMYVYVLYDCFLDFVLHNNVFVIVLQQRHDPDSERQRQREGQLQQHEGGHVRLIVAVI